MKMRSRSVALAAAVLAVGATRVTARSGVADGVAPAVASERNRLLVPHIVVTTPVLASVVRPILRGPVVIDVLVPARAEVHDWVPSAVDIERMNRANFVIANGRGLEVHLLSTLKRLGAQGRASFAGSTLLPSRANPDPHVWLDPLILSDWLPRLQRELAAVGIASTIDGTRRSLHEIDRKVRSRLDGVPAANRRLVTSHESMGLFARRYRFGIDGAAIASMSADAGASAGRLARLIRTVRAAGVPAVFSEIGTSPSLMRTIARDAHVEVVPLRAETLPADGTYRSLMLDLADDIAGALS